MPYLPLYLLLLLSVAIGYTPLTHSASNLRVKIEGLDKALDSALLDNIRQSLTLVQKQQAAKQQPLPERTIKRLHGRAKQQIEQALQPFGFYQATIETSLKSYNNGDWRALYRIDTGPVTHINSIQLEIHGAGQKEPAIRTVLNKPSLKIGNPLHHPTYTQYKQALLNSAYESGYLDARFSRSELQVDIPQRKANITLILDTGPRYYFGKITIEQNSISPRLIERFITIDQNTPFNTDHLLKLQLRLVDSGYFSHIDIDIQREQAHNQRIPVVVSARPAKQLRYSSSLGYGTDTGPRAGFSLLNRRVNQQGHHLKYGLRLSAVESSLNTQYVIPVGDIDSEYIDAFVTGSREILNDSESLQYNIGSSLNQNRWGGRRQLSLSLKQEDFSFDDEPDKVSLLLIPNITYTHKKTDKALFSRKGYRFSVDIRGASESLLSDTSFLSGQLSGKTVMPLSARSRLISRLALGSIITTSFSDLPPSERFFAGGSESVRGYRYKDIGELSSEGSNIGGRYLVAGSLEADTLLTDNIGIATFFDAGDASINSRLALKTAVGLGLRYRSAIGMIRIDLAHPFEDDSEDIRLHISIGPDL